MERASHLWVQTAEDSWESFLVYDGLLQGFVEASLLFSIALHRALSKAQLRLVLEHDIAMHILSYIDDTFVQVDLPHIAVTMHRPR